MGELFDALGNAFCLDMETALAPKCFEPRQARLLQLLNDNACGYFDLATFTDADWVLLASYLERPELEVYGQNLIFDYRVLYANGVTLRGRLYDSLIASSLIHNGAAKMSHSLEEIARRELGRVLDKSLQAQNWMEAQLNEADIAYAMGDVRTTWDCCHILHEKVAAQDLYDCYTLECALIPAVVSMEHHGLPLDPDVIRETIDFYSSEREAAKLFFLESLDGRLKAAGAPGLPREEDGTFNTRIKDTGDKRKGTKRYAGFNLNSSQQVLAWWKYLGIEPKDDGGKASLDKKVLARFQAEELVRFYLHYKRIEKRLGMAEKLAQHSGDDGRIRARFMPLATGTGRFASSSPNIQQIPRDPQFRGAFRPKAGRVFVQADYAAMELRVAAAIAGEDVMLAAFAEGADLHTRTAALMYGIAESAVSKEQRQQGKALSFAALYGSGANGVRNYCATLGIFLSLKEAADLLRRWHTAYPAFGKWHKLCAQRAIAGEPVRTRINRRRKLFGSRLVDGSRGEVENRLTVQANSLIQGTSADIMKASLVEIHKKLPTGAFLVATVHDEVIVECEETDGPFVLDLVLREMEEAAVPMLGAKVRVKAEGGVLRSWGDK